MEINSIIAFLESLADPSLQESYDNAGLLTGNGDMECTGITCSLDATEEVIREAIETNCNLVVAHHPVIFGGLKKITGKNYVERAVITAIKNDIAIYAIHTNLDNVATGVNGKMASMMGLSNLSVLCPRENSLKKIFTFVRVANTEQVRNAIFAAGGGHIGNYSECSFNAEGTGTFRAGPGTDPYVGKPGELHHEKEVKVEVVIPSFLAPAVVKALRSAHPYEEPAYDIVALTNRDPRIGSGITGELQQAMTGKDFLAQLKKVFGVPVVRHSAFLSRTISRVAICGGAGSFLISKALAAGVDAFVTADMKYHEFFDADGKMLIADIGHYESEQFTIDLLEQVLAQKFPNFAIRKTGVRTNPVHYF
jgi:dinuclear metal center YbgI/SA1388 family protein